jgi:NADH:ubiquinone oxidoreductase subunit 2 (subunit N)
MSLAPFLLITGVGALAAVLTRSVPRVNDVICWGTLVAAVLAALLIVPGQTIDLGESGLATTGYLRLFLVLGSMTGLLLAVVGSAAGGPRDVPAVTLAILATAALALALPDARAAVLASTIGGAVAVLLPVGATGGRAGATAGIRVLRAMVIAGTMAVSAAAWIGRDLSELAAQPIVFGLCYLAMAVAVAIRFGAIPFHAWSARLTDAIPDAALPLVTAWSAAAFAVVALAWADASVAPLLLDLDQVRLVVLAIAVASIFLASVAAWIQDDIEHIVGYSIVGDAGVVLLGVAALDPEAWAPARTWIVAFVVARSAFAAWAASTRLTFHTGRVVELRGWVLESPLLAVGFALVVLASIGLPGLAAFEARAQLASLAIGGPLGLLVMLGTLTPLAYYGRLVAIGVTRRAAAGPRVGADDGSVRRPTWRPVFEAVDVTDLPAWSSRAWAANRVLAATVVTIILGLLALAMSAGAFDTVTTAAGLPPTVERVTESFEPGEPLESGAPEASGVPGASDEVVPSEEPDGSDPSFEPVPTPDSSPDAGASAGPSPSPEPSPEPSS